MLALFAEAASGAADAPTTLTVVLAVVATLGTLGTSVITYLAGRDRLRFDTEAAGLRRAVAECEGQRDADRTRMAEAEAKAEAARAAADKMAGELAGALRELGDLRAEVRDLRDRLYGAK